jgi:hypothetical protein
MDMGNQKRNEGKTFRKFWEEVARYP